MDYHYFPNSYWSRIISLVLAEKGLEFTRRFVDIRVNATFEPTYLDLNPRGVVPTLVDGDETIWDSLKIAAHLDRVGGPPVYTGIDDAEVVPWVERLEAVPVMLFSYSVWVKGSRGERSADILADKVSRARSYAERYPTHRALYERKGDFFEAFRAEVYDEAHVAAQLAEQRAFLDDELGPRTSDGGFVVAGRWSLADAIVTAMLYRYVDLGLLDHFRDEAHPLAAYYRRMCERPSFAAVFRDDPLIP